MYCMYFCKNSSDATVIGAFFSMLSYLAALYRTCQTLWSFRRVLWHGKTFFDNAAVNGPIFKELLIQSGPFYIKLGQWLSQRPDIIPRDFIEHLKSLQHDAPHHDFTITLSALEDAVQKHYSGSKTLSQVFSCICETPLASGSIAQVHRATLNSSESPSGQPLDCVIKVRHPHIVARLDSDLRQVEALFALGRFFGFHLCSIIDIESVMKEMRAQCLLSREVTAMRDFQNHFSGSHNVVFPQPLLWSDNDVVIVETLVSGIRFEQVGQKFDTRDCLCRPNHVVYKEETENTRMLCKRITMAAYIHMILVDGVVHGDCHGGNILYDIRPRTDLRAMRADTDLHNKTTLKASQKPYIAEPGGVPDLYQCDRAPRVCGSDVRVSFVDFGITVRIGVEQRESVVELLVASYAQDVQRGMQVIRHLVVSQNGDNNLSNAQVVGLHAFSSDYAALLAAMHAETEQEGISKILRETLNLLRRHALRIDGNLVRILVNFILIEEDCPNGRENNLFDNTLAYILFDDENGDFDDLMDPISEFFGNNFAMRRLKTDRFQQKSVGFKKRTTDENEIALKNCVSLRHSLKKGTKKRRRRRQNLV